VIEAEGLRATAPRRTPAAQPLNPTLIAYHQPACPHAESLRELRSQLLLRWFNADQTSVAILSAHRRAGCSTLAANLAISFAQLGEPTLLVDANLRAPIQHELFGLSPDAGLSDVLRGRATQADACIPVPAAGNLQILCAGTAAPNPQELVSQAAFTHLIQSALPERFRKIIVDTPCAVAFADAQIIATRARGCLLVARRHRTLLREVERIKSRLAPADAVLLGAVING
jgi:chain length determinant protein tyrosine kinase EpsG